MMTIESIKNDLQNPDYVILGHGTGRSGNSDEIVQSIFTNGLRTKDNSLYYTTIGLDTSDLERLKEKLNQWQHQESKKIILIRLPIKYINLYGESADLDGERFGAFFEEKDQADGKSTYYLNPKFIIGCFDVDKQLIIPNSNYEQELSQDSINSLNSNFEKALKKTKARLERLEKNNFNAQSQQRVNESAYSNLSWDMSEFDDDNIEWEESKDAKKSK